MKGWPGHIISGWKVAGVTHFRSGMPLNITQGVDPTGTGTAYMRPDLTGSFIKFDPRQIQTFKVPSGTTQTGNFFFDPSFVTLISGTTGRQGTLGRNVVSGPGVNIWDLSLSKQYKVHESHTLALRGDFSNLFNHTQFGQPTVNASGANFGKVTYGTFGGVGRARHIQVSLRYSF